MASQDFSPNLSAEAREAVSAAFDAISECHNEVASSTEKVVAKIAHAARALGWPDQVVSGMTNQMRSATQTQIQMMDQTMEAWREQMKLWPALSSSGNWPDADAFKALSVNATEFWARIGQQSQKNWAQMMMSQWVGLLERKVPPKGEDRE